MNILDCAYAMARHEGYADARCLGVKDGLLVFHLVDFPSNTPPPVTGYPEFLVGTTADDLQFVRGPECLAYFDLFEPDQRSEDFLAFRDALRAKEREDEALHDEDDDDDDWSLSSIEDEEMSDDEGFLVSADRFLTGDYTNWHFDPDWIRWQAACAIERFAPLVRYCCLSESGAEIPKPDDGTTLEDRENAPEARRARTCSHLLSIVTKRLFENPRAYFNYGPYWPAVKAILLKEKRLTGRAIEPVIARIYQGEDDLETLIMAELFRSALLRRNPLGETSWCLSENHRHAWRLVDPDMDAGNTSARTLLEIDSHELYETPEEAAAFQSGWWRSANDVRLVGFWRGVPVWVIWKTAKSCATKWPTARRPIRFGWRHSIGRKGCFASSIPSITSVGERSETCPNGNLNPRTQNGGGGVRKASALHQPKTETHPFFGGWVFFWGKALP